MRRRGESGLAAEKLTNDVKLRPGSVEKELGGELGETRIGGGQQKWRESEGEVEGVRLR